MTKEEGVVETLTRTIFKVGKNEKTYATIALVIVTFCV